MIFIENETSEPFDENLKSVVISVIESAIVIEGCPYPVEVSVTVVDEQAIQSINKDNRSIDRVTDVLSFPMVEFDSPADFEHTDFSDEAFNLDTDALYLGDIIICYERAKEQAKRYGHSFEREIGFLTAHSMLHLFGYDHINDTDENIMKSHQEAILSKVGLSR
ncbi:MAG: rRNA maturation RNase YbeY [Vallitaleaceae bacterium]|jgi:probable rRNA maturation factor|nr:rRNA maturation RNase YbeY [Vallitaleaceae bacterium]